MTDFQIRVRSYLFRAGVLLAFIVLTLQLWNLQIVQGETYRELADANRFRRTQVPASRGVIYDRNSELLVRNRPIYNITIIPAFLPDDYIDGDFQHGSSHYICPPLRVAKVASHHPS